MPLVNPDWAESVPLSPRTLSLRQVGEAHAVKRAPVLVDETQVVVIPGIAGAPYIDQSEAVYQHDLDLPLFQREVVDEVAHAHLGAIFRDEYVGRAAVERPGHHGRAQLAGVQAVCRHPLLQRGAASQHGGQSDSDDPWRNADFHRRNYRVGCTPAGVVAPGHSDPGS